MDHITLIGLVSVGLIVLAIIVPKPSQRNRDARIAYLLDRVSRRNDDLS